MKKKDLIDLKDFQKKEIEHILKTAFKLKRSKKIPKKLKGKNIGMLFSKSSTRTRVSFEAGIYQLGGNAIFLSASDLQLGRGESIEDTAKVLGRYLDAMVIRTHKHDDILKMASNTDIPVINALTDLSHPCQVLADVMTMMEKKKNLSRIKVAYVGDGNNVACSLAVICSQLGIQLEIATPKDYGCLDEIKAYTHGNVRYGNDPRKAVSQADFIYTDVWVSMGHEKEKTKRISDFQGYQVDKELLGLAKKNVCFMHCLPAHRGEEVSREVIEGSNSIVFDQAENRLHAQKAVLCLLTK